MGLRRIAEDVAAGRRSQTRARPSGTAAPRGEEPWAQLARPEELGKWHCGGQRSWMTCEDGAEKADGWLVFCADGLLQTHMGQGNWRPSGDNGERLLVEFAGCAYELELRRNW